MLDLLIVLAFVAYAVTAGFRSRSQASRDLHEYFLAGRSLPGWKAGTSMAATQFAADTPLLVTGLVATAGVFALWRLWIYGIAFLLMAFVFSVLWRRAGVLTDAELTRDAVQRQRRAAAARAQGDLLRHGHQLRGHGDGAGRRRPHRGGVPAVARVAAGGLFEPVHA
jgi:Na+/proline symporter